MSSTSPWKILLAVVGCAVAAAAVEVAFAFHAQREWEAVLASLGDVSASSWAFGPRNYLPGAASMAAVSLLCSAIGGQLLTRRPWRSLIALAFVTSTVVAVSFAIAYGYGYGYGHFATLVDMGLPLLSGRVLRLMISIWAGTLVLWLVTTSSAPQSSTGPSSGSVTADDAGPVAAPWDPAADLHLATRRTVIGLVVASLLAILTLVVFFTRGGLQLFFGVTPTAWPEIFSSTPLVLAPLAIVGGWLAGREGTGRNGTIWIVVIVAGVALSAGDCLGRDVSGVLAVPLLVGLGVGLASGRQRLARLATARLGR